MVTNRSSQLRDSLVICEIVSNQSSDSTSACPFCAANLQGSISPFDQVITSAPNLKVIPALGMLVPGYFLAISEEHHLSFADLEETQLAELERSLLDVTGRLATVFGEYFIFEHGSCSTSRSGACIDHAHFHLVPLAEDLGKSLAASMPWRELQSFSDLHQFSGTPYAYLRQRGHHLVMRDPELPSQWLRQKIASFLGHDLWDWAIEAGADNLETSLIALNETAAIDDCGLARLAVSQQP